MPEKKEYSITEKGKKYFYENIYKIGKSKNIHNRLIRYPKYSKLILILQVDNCDLIENILIEKFKEFFIQKLQYGTEYFEGNYKAY